MSTSVLGNEASPRPPALHAHIYNVLRVLRFKNIQNDSLAAEHGAVFDRKHIFVYVLKTATLLCLLIGAFQKIIKTIY